MDSNWPRKGNRNCQIPRSMKNVHSNRVTVHSEETPFLPAFNKRNCSRVRLSFEIQSFLSLLHSAIVEWSKFLSFAFTECHLKSTPKLMVSLCHSCFPMGHQLVNLSQVAFVCGSLSPDALSHGSTAEPIIASLTERSPVVVGLQIVGHRFNESWCRSYQLQVGLKIAYHLHLIMSLLMTGGPLVVVSNRS